MRRVLQAAGWGAGGVVVVLLLLGGSLMVGANSRHGRVLIERVTARLTHNQVLLQGLSGRFPGRLRLQHLVLGDPHGPWLQADDLALDWSPLQLLEGRAHATQFTAARVALLRRPEYPPPPRRSGTPFHLPVTVQIDRLDVPRVELGAALAGTAVALRLQGGGRLRSLQRASLQLTVQRLDQVAATYRAVAQLDARRIRLLLDVDEAADGPLANLIRLPGLGALAVHLQLDGPRNAIATVLQAHVGALQALANGTLDLPGRAAMLDLTVQAPAMAPRAGLSWQRVSLRAHAQGSLAAPTTRAQLEVAGLAVGTLKLESLRADLRGEGQAVALDGMLEGLSLPGPVHALLRDAPITVHGQVRLAGPGGVALDMTLAHRLFNAQAHYEFAGAAADLLTVTVPDIAPWAALAHLNLKGRGALQAQLKGATPTRHLALSAALNVSGGDGPWVRLLAPRADLSAALLFNDEGVQLERSQLNTGHLQASARGDDRHGALDMSWKLTVPSLAALTPAVGGRLSSQGRLWGTLPHLALSASADASLLAHGVPGSIHLGLQGLDLPQRPSARVLVSGSMSHAALSLQASMVSAANGALTLMLQRADWQSAHAEGALSIKGDVRAPVGQLSLRVTRLADLEPVLGQALQGSVDASIVFERPGGRSRAQLSVNAHNVGVPAQQFSALQLSGVIEQPLRQPRLALQLSAEAQLRGVSAKLAATATGAPSALDLHATATTGGGPATASTLSAAATWYAAQNQFKLSTLSGRYRQQDVRLLAPALVSLRNGVSVDQIRLGLASAVVQIEGRLTPQLDVQATVRNLAPAVLSVILPQLQDLNLQGHADADLRLQGSLTDPRGRFSLDAAGLRSANGAARGLPPGTIKVRAQLAAGAADIDVAVDAGDKMRLRANGRVPLHRTVPMAFKVTARMDLSLANPMLAASGQRLLGALTVEAQLGGTWAAPQAHGKATLTRGELQDYPRGLHLSDISAVLDADGAALKLTQLSARAGSGTISASGSVNLGAAGMPLQLQLTARNAQPLKSDLLSADLNMDLRVTGALRPRDLDVAGTVRINTATINIPNALPPNVAVLNVIRPGQQAAPPAAVKPIIARLNLAINAPTGIFVRGRGLNVQVGGTVHATGSSSMPNISGGFDLIRGTFDIVGATLTFSSGRLSFNGTGLHHKIDPTLDFTATTYAAGITPTLTVSGYADAPVITLSSSSGLPQDEILARLLFGESVSQLTTLQIAGIGAALVTMTGAGGNGGFNPLTTVQRALGLNRLVVSGGSAGAAASSTAQANNGATIEAGRYISNRVYIGAKQSTNGLTQGQVQVDLTRKWKLQSTLSSGGGTVQGATPENDPGSSIGMSYQFEF